LTEKSVNSLERLQAVLGLFSEDRLEWTPEEMMEVLGYARPTLYRYLKILKAAGLLTSMPNTGFTLGPKIVELDYLLRKSDTLILSGAQHLQNLTHRYNCTALLLRWYGDKILCVDSRNSVRNPISSYPRGRPMPLTKGAIARSIISFLPRRRLLPIVERNLDDMKSIGLGSTIEEVYESLKRVKKAGFAVAYGEVTPGVVGIAAPVFDVGRSPIASVCVTISGSLVDGSTIDEIGRNVRSVGKDISQMLASHRHSNENHNLI